MFGKNWLVFSTASRNIGEFK